MNTTPRIISFLLFVLTASFPLFAEDALPLNLGSGQPGLRIIYNATNQYIIYIDEFLDESWEVGDDWLHNYPKRQIQVLTERNFGFWTGYVQDLYPFDEQTAFTCGAAPGWSSDYKTFNYWPRYTRVFSTSVTNVDSIMVSKDVYALARSRYGLTTNQLFLGKIGTNIFYWETRVPTKVYYRTTEEKQAMNYFNLPKGVVDVDGVTKALSTNMDVGFFATRKSGWLDVAPYHFTFIEVSFKNAKHLKGNQ